MADERLTAEDRIAIADLFSLNAWAADVGDVDGFVATFSATGVLDVAQRHAGRDAVRAFAELAMRSDPWLPYSQRITSQLIIEGDARRAQARAYLTRTHRLPGKIRNNCMLVWSGYTTATLVKNEGTWLFAEKVERAWEGQIVARIGAWRASR